ncbi:phosphoketolase family protein [Candidatus Peregrinibacteria bacterium]|nr:phosphoketolase family protein [Candidatus Peregrinibacteria bacterium]
MSSLSKTDQKALNWMRKFCRYTDYIGAAQLYLKENFFLDEQLKPEHFKPRILGHWGTVPGLNFIYANLNYLIYKHKCKMLLITGPGHGAPAILANLYLEGTLEKFYKDYTLDANGAGRLIHDFSWPKTKFPSHVTPTVPGSILEGGELGYSLSTAFGAAMDNPDLIVAAIVGDGEAETGPIAAAWHSIKWFNPKTSGAVLPIVHINGYKISNPTLFGTMDDTELTHLFKGYGYEPLIVSEPNVEKKMLQATEKAYQIIREIQKQARKSKTPPAKPKWPVILLRTPKGWKGIHQYHHHLVEGSFHSHGIPIGHPSTDKDALQAVEKWLQSYEIHELIDKKGRPKKEILSFLPKQKYRMGVNPHAIGGNFYKKLSIKSLSKYEIDFKKRGSVKGSSMIQAGKMLRDIIGDNRKNFLVLCPDELESNKLTNVFEKTNRAYMWPIKTTDEHIAKEGRVMEMLSEHTLQGWYQGYLLTGRHGVFVSYEAFATIITSMVDQYAKFLKQAGNVPWRKPVGSAIYILTSVGWRQEHNGFSHQNPSFVSNVLQKHGEFCQIYYPADANSMIVALEETLTKKNSITVIVADKNNLPQWLSLKEAREQSKTGIGIWQWVSGKEASKNPDVVLASAGDGITQEALNAVKFCKEVIPELKIRYVNVSELTSLGLGDYCSHGQTCLTQEGIDHYFTKDKPVVFNYHGYINDIEQILWPHANPKRFTIHGYQERGTTTTSFDMAVANGVSCYHVAMDLIKQGAKNNKAVARKMDKILKQLQDRIDIHQNYIFDYGDDPDDVKNMKW